jgi:hypothetical protein
MIRMYSENDTSGVIDLYDDVETIDDLDIEHVSTRIGDIETFRPKFIEPFGNLPFIGTEDDYPTRGLYSKGIYIDKGVLINKEKLLKIDLIHPENSFISRGLIQSKDESIKLDLNNAENTEIKKGIIQDSGGLNKIDLNTPGNTKFTRGSI